MLYPDDRHTNTINSKFEANSPLATSNATLRARSLIELVQTPSLASPFAFSYALLHLLVCPKSPKNEPKSNISTFTIKINPKSKINQPTLYSQLIYNLPRVYLITIGSLYLFHAYIDYICLTYVFRPYFNALAANKARHAPNYKFATFCPPFFSRGDECVRKIHKIKKGSISIRLCPNAFDWSTNFELAADWLKNDCFDPFFGVTNTKPILTSHSPRCAHGSTHKHMFQNYKIKINNFYDGYN